MDRRRTTGSFEAARTTGESAAVNRLFVYGTLRSGQTARSLVANAVQRCVAARTVGQLYSFPMGYPALTDGTGHVVGELLWLDDLAATLAMLDAFEGEDFARVLRKVTMPSSRTEDGNGEVELWAWVYVLADSTMTAQADPISDGDWVRHWRENLQ